MPGSHGTPPAPDARTGRRLALIVATTQYAGALRELRAPAQDAADFGDLLADPEIGGFLVTAMVDRMAQEIRLAVEDFLADRRPEDLLLIYFSCHGLVDDRRRLYFAATDTAKNRLAATGVEALWVLDQLEECRARQQIVILDCCFSGAFARGAKGESDLDLGERFTGQGRGRVVLTASRGTEYSFEGIPVPGAAMPGSVFTSGLVTGIRTGAADGDGDGIISVDDAYRYAFDHVVATGSAQTPQRWLYGAEGSIVLARARVSGTSTPQPPSVGIVQARSEDKQSHHRRRRTLLWAGAITLALAAVIGAVLFFPGRHTTAVPSAQPSRVVLTAKAPWRLAVDDQLGSGDVGCDYTVSDASTGQVFDSFKAYGTKSRQMQRSGRFAIVRSNPQCQAVQHPTAGHKDLPFIQKGNLGDTDSFTAPEMVKVQIISGQDCHVVLIDATDGTVVDTGNADAGGSVRLAANGSKQVYLNNVTCDMQISTGVG